MYKGVGGTRLLVIIRGNNDEVSFVFVFVI